MMNNEIPQKVQSYSKSVFDKTTHIERNIPFTYRPMPNELILVHGWYRYPSYDFIFGVPDKSNPKYGKEVAFFQFRDTRTKKVRQGFYIDCCELEEMVDGFSKLLEVSRIQRPEMWKEYEKNRIKK